MAEHKIYDGRAEAVVSDVGGTVLSFKLAGEDVLYPWRKTDDGKERGGIPICAPWFGKTEFGDKKHGHLRDLEAVKVSYNDASEVKMTFEHPGSQRYPWAMRYEVGVSVKYGFLKHSLTITRLDDGLFDLAPIDPGFHPCFLGNETDVLVTAGFGKHVGFSKNAESVSIGSPAFLIENFGRFVKGKNVRTAMSLGGSFSRSSIVVFWSDNPEEYFCVEPILEEKKLFNTSSGRRLGIGQSVGISMTLSGI